MAAAVRDAEDEGHGPQVHLLQTKARAAKPSSSSASLARAESDTPAGSEEEVHLVQTKARAAKPSSSLSSWAKAESAILAGFEEEALREHQTFRSEGASRIYTILRIMLFFVSLFLLCGLYDGLGRYRHWARFQACQAKVQRLQRSLQSSGCRALCPYCLEFLSSKKTSLQVVFLCGHCFHVKCMNECYRHMEKSGLCPICDASTASDVATEAEAVEAAAEGAEGGSRGEAQRFILRNLHRRYPDIISKDCVERWASCNTEIWLSELKYPSYHSLLQSAK